MNLLLDAHILLWWLAASPELPESAEKLLRDNKNPVFVSSATMWEIAIKRSLGKLDIPNTYRDDIADQGFRELPITWDHARKTELLPSIHRDPFDRMLVAQALSEDLTLVTTDHNIRKYDVALFPEQRS